MINPDIENVYLIPESELKNLESENVSALVKENKVLKITIFIVVIIATAITISNLFKSQKINTNEKSIYENGFIKLSKALLDWQWYTESNTFRLYVHFLLKVNFKQKCWRGIDINIGEFVTSLDKLHSELNMSIQTIRTSLKRLEKSGYIKVKTTNRYTLIKLMDSDVYTQEFYISNKPRDNLKNKQSTFNKQSTNNN